MTEHNILDEIEGVRVELYDDWSIPFRKPAFVEDGLRLASMEDLAAFKQTIAQINDLMQRDGVAPTTQVAALTTPGTNG